MRTEWIMIWVSGAAMMVFILIHRLDLLWLLVPVWLVLYFRIVWALSMRFPKTAFSIAVLINGLLGRRGRW